MGDGQAMVDTHVLIGPAHAVYFLTYEAVKHMMGANQAGVHHPLAAAYETLSTTMNPAKKYDPLSHCTAGALAGGFAAALTTPMDVMKTMLQTRGTATDTELRNVSGFKDSARILYQREGFRGFFKGVRPRVVTAMPSTAICWSAYEACKAYFISKNDATI
ncbi:putative Uncharacterized mitochondrial carrier C8C9.12c [Glarea lozoyensis 74030]|uniref:Putative Uncharacterized mitochondrial carrier C8C9.12c n=1 Tax=Glarea lozoyensis (strain ATCC 74030 / MF5533) TaxID=1104152 RepID=H0EZH9_GLAL7|nr:putative Uncharacterized mitochondrial carrier C8C9.12c [Glarea lozoyensis 74030]